MEKCSTENGTKFSESFARQRGWFLPWKRKKWCFWCCNKKLVSLYILTFLCCWSTSKCISKLPLDYLASNEVFFSARTLWLLLFFFLLYCWILKSILLLSKGRFKLVFNFAPFFCSHFHLASTLQETVLVACIKLRPADFMFVFLLMLPTKLQERLVCLFLWYFNCSLCKLNYARNSMWTFYQNKYLMSVSAAGVASVSFPERYQVRKTTLFCYS